VRDLEVLTRPTTHLTPARSTTQPTTIEKRGSMTLQQDSDHYQGYRTAGIRMREDLLPSLQFHRTDKLFDTIAAIHAFDKAHTVMLVEQGIIPAEAGAAILSSLRHIEGDDGKARLEANGGKHSGEQYLIRTPGEAVGGRM